jgi:hypothetical protein
MVPARRLPVDRLEPQGVSDTAFSSGIVLRDSSIPYALIALRIPPHDPLPRIAYDEDEDADDHEVSERVTFAEELPAVTCESGMPIAIAPSAASRSVLSSSPPPAVAMPVVEPRRSGASRKSTRDSGYSFSFVLAFVAACAAATLIVETLVLG